MTSEELFITTEDFRRRQGFPDELAVVLKNPVLILALQALRNKAFAAVPVSSGAEAAANAYHQSLGIKAVVEGLDQLATVPEEGPNERTHVFVNNEWRPKEDLPPELREPVLPPPRKGPAPATQKPNS